MMKKVLYFIIVVLILFICLLVYGRFVGVNGLTTKEYVIHSNSINTGYEGMKIVHFSDLHYKKVITEQRVRDLVDEINKNQPDIVFFTGDLLDKDYELSSDDINFLIEQLSRIHSKYGNFAVMGDHDYLKEETIKNIYIQSNFTLLDNSYSIIKNEENQSLFVGGVNSYSYDSADIGEVMKYFDDHEDISYKILLMHEPDYIENITNQYSFSLILAGHSLNGSINIPIIKNFLLQDGASNYYRSYYQIDDTDFYISNGIGVSNINFRLFNTPSINVYRIYK